MQPLVEPGPALSPDRLVRYSRQLMLDGFDEVAQRRLLNARVLVVGAGGLGSASIPYLASAGVGTIGVVDVDTVELSNLHRQVVHGVADIGRAKVDSIVQAVAAIDPGITVVRHPVWLDAANALEIVGGYDLVLDGSDNFATRYLTNDAAELAHLPLVWGAILQFSGQAGVAWAEHGPTYRDLFPAPPAPGEVLSCAEGGVLPGVAAVVGGIMATEAVKLVTGIGEPLLGRVVTYDALTGRHRELSYERDPERMPVAGLVDLSGACEVADADGPVADGPVADTPVVAAPGTAGLGTEARLLSPAELARRLRSGEPMQLVDIREPFEARIARIEGSELIPMGSLAHALGSIRSDVPVVLYCHHGVRSAQAATFLREAGFGNVEDLAGGIERYAVEVDPSLARY